MRICQGLVVALAGVAWGCSFIGARVPDNPTSCPRGVVIADLIGTSLTVLPLAGFAYDLTTRDKGSPGDVLLPVIIPVLGALAITYTASTIYGVRVQRRCERAQEALLAEQQSAAIVVRRADVVANAPLHCAPSGPDTGRCYLDADECARDQDLAGGSCEQRADAWCFDAGRPNEPRRQTICTISLFDCDDRRTILALRRSLVVSTCASYRVATPDAGTPDAGTPDAGTPDAGTPDTGTPDTNTDASL